jgi:hypothetical protein
LYFVWHGIDVQKRELDVKFKHQSRENALLFNKVTAEYVQKMPAYMNFSVLDTWQMTHDAASSDGYHYLSEPNLLKAMYVYNLMDMLV